VIPDLISNRIFGGMMVLTDGVNGDTSEIVSSQAVTSFELKVVTDSKQEACLETWCQDVREQLEKAVEGEEALRRTACYWKNYFHQSWFFIEKDGEPFAHLTQAYILTKWMFACCSRGNFPILYNGMLFNLMPGASKHFSLDNFKEGFAEPPAGEPNLEFNPDERTWSIETLWQNLRLSYHSMLARGEQEPLKVVFRYYRRFWELNKARAKLYYGAEGQHNTEMTHTFGLQSDGIYGFDREGIPDGYADNRWGGAIDISPGLELIAMMLDYYDYTQDEAFLSEELIPYAEDLFLYIVTRFKERVEGKILISPINCIETYWNTTNPTPIVAGMHGVLDRILKLPKDKLTVYDKFEAYKMITPPVPVIVKEGHQIIAPAKVFEEDRKNVEIPEFYSVFPFKLYGLDKPEKELAVHTYYDCMQRYACNKPYTLGHRVGEPSYSGWQYAGMTAALLGLTDEAREMVLNNSQLSHPSYCFPVMWGPIYDAVPDVDHGANLLNTLQLMAFQIEGDTIRILPSWPKEWDISFKFHAPKQTIVECIYKNGKIEKLEVIPQERMKDIVHFYN